MRQHRWMEFLEDYDFTLHYHCHTPDPGPTRLANPNRFRGAKPYAGTPHYYYFFFRADLICGIQIIFVITNNHLHLKMNYHQSGIH